MCVPGRRWNGSPAPRSEAAWGGVRGSGGLEDWAQGWSQGMAVSGYGERAADVRLGATGATQIEGKVTNIPKSRLHPQVRPYMAWVQPYLQVRAWTDSVGIGVSRVCSRSHAEEGSHPDEVRPNV